MPPISNVSSEVNLVLQKMMDEINALWEGVEPVTEEAMDEISSEEVFIGEESTVPPLGYSWPPTPTGMAYTTEADENTRNKQDSLIHFTWDNMGAGVRYLFQYRKTGKTIWKDEAIEEPVDVSTTISQTLHNKKHGQSYDWQVQSISGSGEDESKSDFCAVQIAVAWSPTKTDIPVVSSVKIKGQELTIKFERIAKSNFDKIEVFGALSTSFTPDTTNFTNLIGRTENVTFKYTLPATWIDVPIYLRARIEWKDETFSAFCAEFSASWGAPTVPVPGVATVNLYHKKKDTFAEITFPWSASTDPEGDKITYEVHYWIVGTEDKVKKKPGIKETSFTKDGLEDNVTYGWKVRAKDEHGKESAFSADQTIATGVDTTKPADPAAGSFTIVARKGAFNADWKKNSEKNIHEYVIYVNTVNNSATAKVIARVSHPTSKKTLNLGLVSELPDVLPITLTAGTTYYFWLEVVNVSEVASLNRVASDPPSASVGDNVDNDTTPPTPNPVVITSATPSVQNARKGTMKCKIIWGAATDSSGKPVKYQIYYAVVGEEFIESVTTPQTSITLKNLDTNSTYAFTVLAYDWQRNFTSAQDPIPTFSVTDDAVAPSNPTNIILTVKADEFEITFDKSTEDSMKGGGGYKLYVYTVGDGTRRIIDDISHPAHQFNEKVNKSTYSGSGDYTLAFNTSYYFEVEAYTRSGTPAATKAATNPTNGKILRIEWLRSFSNPWKMTGKATYHYKRTTAGNTLHTVSAGKVALLEGYIIKGDAVHEAYISIYDIGAYEVPIETNVTATTVRRSPSYTNGIYLAAGYGIDAWIETGGSGCESKFKIIEFDEDASITPVVKYIGTTSYTVPSGQGLTVTYLMTYYSGMFLQQYLNGAWEDIWDVSLEPLNVGMGCLYFPSGSIIRGSVSSEFLIMFGFLGVDI